MGQKRHGTEGARRLDLDIDRLAVVGGKIGRFELAAGIGRPIIGSGGTGIFVFEDRFNSGIAVAVFLGRLNDSRGRI